MIAGQMFANRSGHHRYFLQPYGLRLEGFFGLFFFFFQFSYFFYKEMMLPSQSWLKSDFRRILSMGLGCRDPHCRGEHTESLGFSLLLKI